MKVHRGWITLAMLALTSVALAQSNATRVAVINGEAITEEQLNQAASTELQTLEMKRLQNEAGIAQDKHQILEKALEAIVTDKLIALEATKNKVSKEQLLDAEVNSKVELPSNADVESFYEANKERIPIPKDEALPQVKQYLAEQNRNQFREAWVTKLKNQYAFKSYLEPLRTEIASAGFPSRGAAAAPVTIVEFSDFECPYCGGLFPTLKQVEKNYPDKVRIVYRQFPLSNIHTHAQKAAEASLCANEQQHFWEFHDSMFSNQRELSVPDLKQRAVDLKLDTAAFNQCLDSGKHAGTIQKDIVEGSRAGVTGTPAIFINGRLLSGNQPYAEIKDIIEDELQRKQPAK